MGSALQDMLPKLVIMEKIVQRAIIKIEERSQNNGNLIDGWRGWMPPTAEKRGVIIYVLADDSSGGIEFSRPLDNCNAYWQWCGGVG